MFFLIICFSVIFCFYKFFLNCEFFLGFIFCDFCWIYICFECLCCVFVDIILVLVFDLFLVWIEINNYCWLSLLCLLVLGGFMEVLRGVLGFFIY